MKVAVKRNQSSFLIVFLAFLSSQPGTSQSAPSNKGPFPLFSALDGNRDGVLDPYEALDVLIMMESDQQGQKLNIETLEKILARHEQDKRQEMSQMLAEMDKNGDQRTELAEMDPEMREMAALLDQNKDGVLTLEEVMSQDLADSILMSEEAIQQEVAQVFSELDKDKNNKLTRSEVGDDNYKHFSESDVDGDGLVTRHEFKTFMTINNTTASFTVRGDTAVMSGVIAADTPAKVLRLVFQYPKVQMIVMDQVPGSIDDEANLRAARYIRNFGFTTILRSRSMVASGGTDFFLAGSQRKIEKGARLGIHSWGGPGYQGKDVPRDDPQHQLYLDYYKEMDIPVAFYWRTLEAAPVESIHWMTDDELKQFKFRTAEE